MQEGVCINCINETIKPEPAESQPSLLDDPYDYGSGFSSGSTPGGKG
jgi:hypothetical protein